MRISTNMIFDAGVGTINKQWAELIHLQQQVSTGRRILTPSDDPVAAARALEVQQSADIASQMTRNQDNARSALGLEDVQLGAASDLLVRVKELAVQAGGPMTVAQRQSVTAELRARYDELMGIGNSTDGGGLFMFAGYQGATRPFSRTIDDMITNGGDVQYAGDAGQRRLQVSATRYIEVADAGSDVFMGIDNGTGGKQSLFRTIADLVGAIEDPTNTGAAYTADIQSALGNIDRGLDNVLRVRAAVGSHMNELDSLTSANTDLGLQYQQTLSNLQDIDYATTISALTRKQTDLEAAQKSFMSTSQLSLFKYL